MPANLAIFHDPLLTAANKLAEEDRRERNNKNSSKREGEGEAAADREGCECISKAW